MRQPLKQTNSRMQQRAKENWGLKNIHKVIREREQSWGKQDTGEEKLANETKEHKTKSTQD